MAVLFRAGGVEHSVQVGVGGTCLAEWFSSRSRIVLHKLLQVVARVLA